MGLGRTVAKLWPLFASALIKDQVYVMKCNGSEQTRIGNAERDAQNPVWSPDGNQILYYETDSTGHDEIYLMNSVGTERHRLIKDAWPSWYPDASKILARSS